MLSSVSLALAEEAILVVEIVNYKLENGGHKNPTWNFPEDTNQLYLAYGPFSIASPQGNVLQALYSLPIRGFGCLVGQNIRLYFSWGLYQPFTETVLARVSEN